MSPRGQLHADRVPVQVGSELMPDELQSVREHAQRHGALASVVAADWLRACAARRLRESEAGWLVSSAALCLRPPAQEAPACRSSDSLPAAGASSRDGPGAAEGEGMRQQNLFVLCRRAWTNHSFHCAEAPFG
jgi:hypothetical protein